jgi:hypothetical protein
MKRINFHPYLLITLVAFFLAWLTGCSTPEKLVTKAYKKDPVYVADWTRTKFPCVTGQVKKGDSVSYKKYLEDLAGIEEFYNSISTPEMPENDTIIEPWEDSTKILSMRATIQAQGSTINKMAGKVQELLKRCKDAPVIHDTLPVKDSAEIFLMQNEVAKCDNLNKELTIKLKRSQKFNFWLVIALLLAGGVIYLLSRKR